MIRRKRNLLIVFLPLFLGILAHAQAFGQQPPFVTQPSASELVQQVVTTELKAGAADKSQWLYYEQDNKPKVTVIQWVAQTPTADLARILEQDGQKLPETKQHEKMDAFLHDTSAQSKGRKKQQEDIKQTVELLKLLPVAFLWSTTSNQDGISTLHFKPDPGFHPPNAEARILGAVEGDFVVNNSQRRIISLNGKLLHDVKFGGGLLGEIKSGGTFAIGRKEVTPGEWQITETHVHFAGHMLLFKSVSEQEDDIRCSFKQMPEALTLEQARNEVLKMSDPLSR